MPEDQRKQACDTNMDKLLSNVSSICVITNHLGDFYYAFFSDMLDTLSPDNILLVAVISICPLCFFFQLEELSSSMYPLSLNANHQK